MKKTFLIFVTLIAATSYISAQTVEAYRIFDKNGKQISETKMLKKLENADIILFGEFHNNPISHWLEFEVTEYLGKSHKLILGAEMFEADNQDNLNKYLQKSIDRSAFDSLVRLWPNYETDYSPLVEFAQENGIKFIATNIPRIYAKLVNKGGFEALDSLSELEKSWISPLPILYDPELSCYKQMAGMAMGKSSSNLPKAQAIKDATMAHFILHNFVEGYIFLHFNGSYHSDNYESILWYLKKEKPNLNYITITTVSQNYVNKLYDDNKGKADFTICVDNDMTTTY